MKITALALSVCLGIVALLTVPTLAQAQLGRPIGGMGGTIDATERQGMFFESPEIPTSPECTTSFTEGSDGIFKRTSYCHRANPTRPSGFLQAGFDVPAAFLTGYTEQDVRDRWKNGLSEIDVMRSAEYGTQISVPVDLLTQLNATSARAWEQILSCAQGNADLAREMYRTAHFACGESAVILSLIHEVRQNIPILAATTDPAIFLNQQAMFARYRQLQTQIRALSTGSYRMSQAAVSERYQMIYPLRAQSEVLAQLMQQSWYATPGEIFQSAVPSVPRSHPLFIQMVVEEFLSLMSPNHSSNSEVARLRTGDGAGRAYFKQISAWLSAIEDRNCSSFGLWPSASRTAITAVGDILGRTIPETHDLKARLFMPVACKGIGSYFDSQRLPQVYMQGANEIWNEFRAVRSLYASPVSN